MRRLALLLCAALCLLLAPTWVPASASTASVKTTPRTIAAGALHVVVIGGDGKVFGTGANGSNQLSGGNPSEVRTLAPVVGLPSGVKATSVAAGGYFSLVLGSNGKVYGVGSNTFGQLTGSGDRSALTALTGLPAGVTAKAIAARGDYSLVLASNGKVYGAGTNAQGQLTGVNPAPKTTLTPLTGLPAGVTAIAISAGNFNSVVLGSNHHVYGTGTNVYGQLTTLPARTTLTAFTNEPPTTVTAIASGAAATYMKSGSSVWGVGRNDQGELGNGTYSGGGVISRATGVSGIVAMGTGDDHLLVVDSTGGVYGTGLNENGALTGNSSGRNVLDDLVEANGVPGPRRVVEVVGGNGWSLVRDSDGLVFGTGKNLDGQLTGVDTSPRYALTVLSGQKIANATRPTITGTKTRGHRLSGHVGDWSVRPTSYTYRWLRNGVSISGATGSTYLLRSADVGKRISLKVTGSRTGFTSVSAISSSTTKVK